MLKEISVKNFALIENITLELHSGLLVLSGETGAGKSLILDALSILCGRKSKKEFIRRGAEEAVIEGLFMLHDNEIKKIMEMDLLEGFTMDERELYLSRTISNEGKNVTKINFKRVPQSVYTKVTSILVDIHGQNNELTLVNENAQLELVDSFSSENDQGAYENLKKAYGNYEKIAKELRNAQSTEVEKEEIYEYYKKEIAEINKAQLDEEEENELLDLKKKYASLEAILGISQELEYFLEGSEPLNDKLSQIGRLLNKLSALNDDFQEVEDQFFKAKENLDDAFFQYGKILLDYELDDLEGINKVESRLNEIRKVVVKHGGSIPLTLNKLQQLEQEVYDYDHKEEVISSLEVDLEKAKKDYYYWAKEVSLLRHKGKEYIESNISQTLESLGIFGDGFKIQFTETEKISSKGVDEVSFLFSPNKGEGPKKLKEIASGGEMSRVMLAFKSIFSKKDGINTLIFDEVDTGIGGDSLQKVAKVLKGIAQGKQVLSVTHGPIIAAFADHQYFIGKETIEDRTKTYIKYLESDEDRLEEISRMISGEGKSQVSIAQSMEMLEKGREELRE